MLLSMEASMELEITQGLELRGNSPQRMMHDRLDRRVINGPYDLPRSEVPIPSI